MALSVVFLLLQILSIHIVYYDQYDKTMQASLIAMCLAILPIRCCLIDECCCLFQMHVILAIHV